MTAPTLTTRPVRCGNRARHGEGVYHTSTTEVRLCFAGGETEYDRAERALIEADLDAELGFERALEDRGFDAAREDEVREMAMGVWAYRA